MGILGIVTMPLGLDAELCRQMGYDIERINAVGLGAGKSNKLMVRYCALAHSGCSLRCSKSAAWKRKRTRDK